MAAPTLWTLSSAKRSSPTRSNEGSGNTDLNSKGSISTDRHEPAGSNSGAGDIFEAIGFDVVDEDSYNLLAEYAERAGERSTVYRADITLHGRCWKLGDGLEVWSVIYESPSELYFADCRPAFRSRYVYSIQPWEMAEYCEDGEAIVHGKLCPGPDIFFELQNFTEVKNPLFRRHRLQVALAGLASTAAIPRRPKSGGSQYLMQRFYPLSAEPDSNKDSYENEYVVSGTILAHREIHNSVTEERLVWVFVDAGKIRLEVLVNGRSIDGRPSVGSNITATVWLQGHVLQDNEISARYEGIDLGCVRSDFWAGLRRNN
jgi:hypothetical protein